MRREGRGGGGGGTHAVKTEITDMGSVLKLKSEPYGLKPKTQSIRARSGF